jgi:hypothetical protein
MQTQTRRLPRLMVHQQAGQARQTTQPRRRTTQGRAHTRGREAREVHGAAGRKCAGRGRVPEQGVQQPLPPCPHAPGHTNLGQLVQPAAQVHVRRPPLPHSLGGGGQAASCCVSAAAGSSSPPVSNAGSSRSARTSANRSAGGCAAGAAGSSSITLSGGGGARASRCAAKITRLFACCRYWHRTLARCVWRPISDIAASV